MQNVEKKWKDNALTKTMFRIERAGKKRIVEKKKRLLKSNAPLRLNQHQGTAKKKSR